MKYYKHKFNRNVKDLDRALMEYFFIDEKKFNKLKNNEKHFINLLKLQFIYEVELNKKYNNFSSAIFHVIWTHRAKFEDKSELKKNTFYLITETEIKKHLINKYKFKMIVERAVMQKGSYGNTHFYNMIKIISKIN